MKTLFSAGLCFSVMFTLFFICCNNASQADKKAPDSIQPPSIKKTTTDSNMYNNLRQMAFEVTPEQLGLSATGDKTIVYGVILDWEVGSGIATLVSFQTGDASLYLSSGGGVIGGGQHADVNRNAKLLVEQAPGYLAKAVVTHTFPLPGKDEVFFYLLTNKGVCLGTEKMENFENGSSHWLTLFNQANNVMTELRRTTEQ